LTAVRELPPGAQVRIADQGRVVIAYVEDAREFELHGPGRYRLDAAGPRALEGASAPIMRELPAAYRAVRLDATKLKQLGVVMRGNDRDSLTPRGVLVEVPTTLAWSTPTIRPPYTVTLADYAGTMILQQSTDQT